MNNVTIASNATASSSEKPRGGNFMVSEDHSLEKSWSYDVIVRKLKARSRILRVDGKIIYDWSQALLHDRPATLAPPLEGYGWVESVLMEVIGGSVAAYGRYTPTKNYEIAPASEFPNAPPNAKGYILPWAGDGFVGIKVVGGTFAKMLDRRDPVAAIPFDLAEDHSLILTDVTPSNPFYSGSWGMHGRVVILTDGEPIYDAMMVGNAQENGVARTLEIVNDFPSKRKMFIWCDFGMISPSIVDYDFIEFLPSSEKIPLE